MRNRFYSDSLVDQTCLESTHWKLQITTFLLLAFKMIYTSFSAVFNRETDSQYCFSALFPVATVLTKNYYIWLDCTCEIDESPIKNRTSKNDHHESSKKKQQRNFFRPDARNAVEIDSPSDSLALLSLALSPLLFFLLTIRLFLHRSVNRWGKFNCIEFHS